MQIKTTILYKSASVLNSDTLRRKAIRSELKGVQNTIRELEFLRGRKARFEASDLYWDPKSNSGKNLEKYERREGYLKWREKFLLNQHKAITEEKIKELLRKDAKLSDGNVTVLRAEATYVRSPSSNSA